MFPLFCPYSSIEAWQEKNQQITEWVLEQYGSEGGDNYDNARYGAGNYWLIVQPETEHLFSPEKLAEAKTYDQINWDE